MISGIAIKAKVTVFSYTSLSREHFIEQCSKWLNDNNVTFIINTYKHMITFHCWWNNDNRLIATMLRDLDKDIVKYKIEHRKKLIDELL